MNCRPAELRRKIGRWLDASIGNRIAAVLVTLSLGFMIVVGAGNFTYLIQLTQRAATERLAEAVRDAAHDLERAIAAIDDDILLLANNPTVISAVLDARGQETYLHPLLSRFRPHGRSPQRLCVTDYKGRSIGCSVQPMTDYANQGWLTEAIANSRSKALISIFGSNMPVLKIVRPITYEGTGGAEGAVVAEYELAGLLTGVFGESQRFDHVHLTGVAGELYLSGQLSGITHSGRDLALEGPLAELGLHLNLGIHESAFNAPLLRLLAVYSLISVLLVLAAFWVAKCVVPPLIGRLSDITNAARRVASGEALNFDAATAGEDEIAQLARAFSTMTGRLAEINQSLEAEVDARTAELRQQEVLLHSIINAVPGVIFQLRMRPDGSLCVPFLSGAAGALYGLTPEAVRDDAGPLFERVHPDDRAEHLASIRRSAAQLDHWQAVYRITRPTGQLAWLLGNALPQKEADGAILWHGVITDITEQKQAELALAESEAFVKALFTSSYLPLVIIDPDSGGFIDCNEAAVSIYGVEHRENVLGKTMAEVSAPVQYDGINSEVAARMHIAAALAIGLDVFEWRHRRPSGELWDAEVRLMSFRHRGRTLLQFSLRDITEQKRSEAEIWHKANFDGLTGLANRSLCRDRLERELAQARRRQHKLGVLFLDLDGFKGINDSLGHAAGDELLVEVARRLQRCVREQDTAARFGGDEFVLLVNDLAEREDLRRVAEEVVAVSGQPFSLGGQSCRISCSVGVAVFPDDASEGDGLLECADAALYRSKRSGKNRYTFYSAPVEPGPGDVLPVRPDAIPS